MRLSVIIFLLLIQHFCSAQKRYDVIIDELMIDPSPQVGLPNAEYIELKNVSQHAINLNGWQVEVNDESAVIKSSFWLMPDSFVILCSNSNVSIFSLFGGCVPLNSFSALNNDEATVTLLSAAGQVMHAVRYNKSWYDNAVKANGGWSLEMIDTKKACTGRLNWKASTSASGGSPGKRNAVEGIFTDFSPPVLLNAYARDSLSVIIYFDEPLDSITAVIRDQYIVSDAGAPLIAVSLLPPLFDGVLLRFSNALKENQLVQIIVRGLADCSGNRIKELFLRTGLAGSTDRGDVIINEVLFNPGAGGSDFIELYNRSKKIIDLKDLYISSRNSTGVLGTALQQAVEPKLLLPGKYVVLSENPQSLKQQYRIDDEAALLQVNALPSMPDDKGSVVVLNSKGIIMDELAYDEHWHFKLLDNKEGISLERISAEGITQDAQNWHSASGTSGFGTPGYKNSQDFQGVEPEASFLVQPAIFSPDNNGIDDFTNIQYKFPEAGYVATITIFNLSGTPVRFLARNVLCGISGIFRWDGLDERGSRLSRGIYILLIECLNMRGKQTRFKKTITLASN